MRSITIDGRLINDEQPAYVIAEIGHNHAGDMDRARAMVDTAVAAGASAVKFQTRHSREVYCRDMYDAPFDNPHAMGPTYGAHREALEPSPDAWRELFAHCREQGITAFSTPFDFQSVDLLASLDVPAFKVASGDATNIPMIEYIAETGKPLIVSVGGCDMADVERVHECLAGHAAGYALLQCSCVYPCPPELMNLRVIDTLRRRFPDTVVGLSTHNPSWVASIAAHALGARIFEHHYSNDRGWKGTDNHFSLTPESLALLVAGLEESRLALGRADKQREEKELVPTLERRKKLVWQSSLSRGAEVRREHIAIKCPGDGIAPYDIDRVIGRRLAADVTAENDILDRELA